jgi:hypothetical protein
MLNGKNLRAKRCCKKLEDKMYWPFEVINTGLNGRYCKLKLPSTWKIHPTFNISLLERYRGTDPKKQVIEIEDDSAGWKMESIITSGPSDDDPRKHVYLAKREGYSHDENTWEKHENVSECSLDLVKEYYGKNPSVEKDGHFGKKRR